MVAGIREGGEELPGPPAHPLPVRDHDSVTLASGHLDRPERLAVSAAPELAPCANTACPYCGAVPDPLPKAKSRHGKCRHAIYVRSGPDGFRYLLQDVDLPVLEAARAEFNDPKAAEEARERSGYRERRWGTRIGMIPARGAEPCGS